jgi:hypothetical protein
VALYCFVSLFRKAKFCGVSREPMLNLGVPRVRKKSAEHRAGLLRMKSAVPEKLLSAFLSR